MGIKLESIITGRLIILRLYTLALLLNKVILLNGAGLVSSNSVLSPYPVVGPLDPLHRRYLKGREVIPSVTSNAIPGEPTCEELRAMWRYYKRQSRAELTNEIPRFGSNLFWDVLPVAPHQSHISSFLPMKGRAKARLKLKNSKAPAYGKMVYKAPKEKTTVRPMQRVAELMGRVTPSGAREEGGSTPQSIIHYSPPPTLTPNTPSSFQQIRNAFREERIREKGGSIQGLPDNGKTFGRVILGPPKGTDGRVANKPKELMTPFEKIRFGHANELLEDGNRPNLNLMVKKRRTLPLHLKPKKNRRNEDVWIERGPVDNNNNGGYVVVEPGSFGSFLPDQDVIMEEPVGLDSSFSPSPGNELSPLLVEDRTCPQVKGLSCQTNNDCACVGFGLYRCYLNQCQTISFSTSQGNAVEKEEDDTISVWHSEPVSQENLGLWKSSSAEIREGEKLESEI